MDKRSEQMFHGYIYIYIYIWYKTKQNKKKKTLKKGSTLLVTREC